MTYLIQTAHPNETDIRYIWPSVDQAEDEQSALDIIRSPSFEIYDGLMVRVVSAQDWLLRYSGIYRGSECVCVDYGSNVSKKYPWDSNEVSIDLAKGRPWWMTWVMCEEPSWMIRAVKNAISYDRLVDALADCIESTIPFSSENKRLEKSIAKGIKTIKNNNRYKLPSIYGDLNSQVPNTQPIHMLAESTMNLAYSIMAKNNDNIEMSNDMIYACVGALSIYVQYRSGKQRNPANKMVCNKIRNALPFYEIALAITNP